MSVVKQRYLLLRAILVSSLFGHVAAYAGPPNDRDGWMAASRVGTPAAYQSFMDEFPDSPFTEKAFEAWADSFDTAAGGEEGGAGAGGEGQY